MNFEEFKKRYTDRMEKGGVAVPTEGEELTAFERRVFEIFVGLIVAEEYRFEQLKKEKRKGRG